MKRILFTKKTPPGPNLTHTKFYGARPRTLESAYTPKWKSVTLSKSSHRALNIWLLCQQEISAHLALSLDLNKPSLLYRILIL